MADKYWVGSGSTTSWDAITPTNWSLTDGGANDAAVPATDDDVFFKSAADCTMNSSTSLNSLDMTGYTGTITPSATVVIRPSTGNTTVCILDGTITGYIDIALEPRGTAVLNLTTNNRQIKVSSWYGDGTGTTNFQDAIIGYSLVQSAGTLNTNGYGITLAAHYSIPSSETVHFNFTNSTISLLSSWSLTGTVANYTLTSTGSNITCSGSFIGASKTYNNVILKGNATSISGDNIFNKLNINSAGLGSGVAITAGSTQTVTDFATNGSSGNLAKMTSTSAGSAFTLTSASSRISIDYMSIKDSTAAGVATWYAGANSTDVSGNTGWTFTAPPPTFSKFIGVAAASIGKANGVAIASVGKILGIDAP